MGIGKTTCVFSLPNGRHATPGMWFQYAGVDPDLSQLQDLSHDIAAAFDASAYQADLDSNVALDHVESQLFEVVTVDESPTYPYGRRNSPTSLAGLSDNTPIAGGQAGSNFPSPQVAMGVTLYTARAGKSYRGRVYLPGLSRNSISEGGDWTSGAVGEADAFVTAWRDAIQASAPVELIPSVHGLRIPSDEPIVLIVGKTVTRTQRRRVRAVL